MTRARLQKAAVTAAAAAGLAVLLAGCGSRTKPKTRTVKPRPAPTTDWRFESVAAEQTGVDCLFSAGIAESDYSIMAWMGSGVAILDFDQDGVQDLLLTGGGGFQGTTIVGAPTKLYRGAGSWRYEDVSDLAAIPSPRSYTQGCHVGDYDNDGFPDVLVTGYDGLQLLQNQGDGTLLDTTEQAGLASDSLWSTGAAWADFNSDGLLDLYVTHYVDWSFENHPLCLSSDGGRNSCPPLEFNPLPDSLYLNNGDGSFRDESSAAGLLKGGNGLGVLAADLDDDGDTDVYVANDATANYLYLNDGHGRFEEAGQLRGVAGDDVGNVDGSMGVDVGDYDLDGRPDLWVANYVREANALYRNLGRGEFQHVSKPTGLNNLGGLFVGFGTAFADLECDGDEDLVVANGHVVGKPPTAPVKQLPLLLMNQDGFHRIRLPESSYFASPHLGRGLATCDLDDDGDLDLVVTHLVDEPPALLRNDTPRRGDWLRVHLIGTASNRGAVGAELRLHTSDRMLLRVCKGGGSYLSHSDPRPFFGIPAGATIEKLVITWPSGEPQTITDVELNTTLQVVEP